MEIPTRQRISWRHLWRQGLSPRQFTWLATLGVVCMALIVVTGAAVRLTGSGLGCSDWPKCSSGHFVAPLQFHAWVEFGNRLVTVGLSVAVALAVVGALLRRPLRRDLLWLSFGLVVGLIAEIVMGGVVVLVHLAPAWVAGHFMLSFVVLADAVILRHRAQMADETFAGGRLSPRGRGWAAGKSVPVLSSEHMLMGRLLLVATAVVVVFGTVVTGTGPHGGSPDAPRFAFTLHDVAQLHGTSVEVYLAFLLLYVWMLHRSAAPAAVMRRVEVLLAVLVAQAAVGYTQYFTGVPALLVALHVAGAVAVVLAAGEFNLALRTRSRHSTRVTSATAPPEPSVAGAVTASPAVAESPTGPAPALVNLANTTSEVKP